MRKSAEHLIHPKSQLKFNNGEKEIIQESYLNIIT